MAKIDGDTKNLKDLFNLKRYVLDSYQREYRWETNNIAELLEDFSKAFFADYKSGDKQSAVLNYKPYFLGTVVVSAQDGVLSIIDGQQRLTSLTLLLIYLNNLQKTHPDQVSHLDRLIYDDNFGTPSFNIDVDERRDLLDSLFREEPYIGGTRSESVRNMQSRYEDIAENFPDELKQDALPVFIQWLTTNVNVVVITAPSARDAYAIFESMNDRGLSLTPTEMLKGYLMDKLHDLDETTQKQADNLWRTRIQALKEQERDGDAAFIRAWFRAKLTKTPTEFEDVGYSFHQWLREKHSELKRKPDPNFKLESEQDFKRFLVQDFDVYSNFYLRIIAASKVWNPALREVFFNAGITLQPTVILASIAVTDSNDIADRKMRVVGSYLDIYIARRIVNYRAISRRVIEDKFYRLIPQLRGLTATALAAFLKADLAAETQQFQAVMTFGLHQQNGPQAHYILARLTDYIEQECGASGDYIKYMNRDKSKDPYEIEHIWANKYERHNTVFTTEQEFLEQRNRLGDLILLRKSVNASLNDLPYDQKVAKYSGENILASSLTPLPYQNNPRFKAFLQNHSLPFQAYPTAFTKNALDARQSLYQKLCESVWNPDRLDAILI